MDRDTKIKAAYEKRVEKYGKEQADSWLDRLLKNMQRSDDIGFIANLGDNYEIRNAGGRRLYGGGNVFACKVRSRKE